MDKLVDGAEAEYGFRVWLFEGTVWYWGSCDGCAKVSVGRTRSVPFRYGTSCLRALFKVHGLQEGGR